MNKIFIQEPFIEWHNETPFAITYLNPKYAHLLSKLALEYENEILELPPDKNWKLEEQVNTTTSRYSSYNVFLMNSAYLNLFLATRDLFRFFLEKTNQSIIPCYIRSWYNIRRLGERISRHTHNARFIGSFWAFSEGSYTSYGPLKKSNELDHKFENKDGMLMITKSNNGNFHEVPPWHNKENPRVSYAFDIIDQFRMKKDKAFIPFDG